MATLLPTRFEDYRLNQNQSKLPSFRPVDLGAAFHGADSPAARPSFEPAQTADARDGGHQQPHDHHKPQPQSQPQPPPTPKHSRTHSESVGASPLEHATRSRHNSHPPPSASAKSTNPDSPETTILSKARGKGRIPASHSRNDLRGSWTGPPPSFPIQLLGSATSAWVDNQTLPPSITIPTAENLDSAHRSRPPISIKPIRGFRTSRRGAEMSARRSSIDQDGETLRALEFDRESPRRLSNFEQDSDDSDQFLRLAREEGSMNNSATRGTIRRSTINHQSLPPSIPLTQSVSSRRRGSDADSASGMSQALSYRSSARERAAPLDDVSRSRYYPGNSRSNPTTPRATGGREMSPESQGSYGGRKPSVYEPGLPSRTSSYRQSNLSFSTPRTYNSSPLVSRTGDVHDTSETPRLAEGTESTVSTTAPSTVWDELDDLKSRIHRLELTGKLPATSGAAISRASNDRPPTATTTVTTMSSSPKHGHGNSISPADAVETDIHPLLHAALTKSKSLLSPEVYRALETAASDALSIAAMMGTSGHPGLISSSQSTTGAAYGASDRQVRRKADSMCRSLTELCLALSEGQETRPAPPNNQLALVPTSHNNETITNIEQSRFQRPPVISDIARQSSPRALSHLEARRSSLLATSSLPTPRYAPSEGGTPTQSALTGRRTSLLLRTRRAGTEGADDEDDSRFRVPSRAATDLGRPRNTPREYAPQQQQSPTPAPEYRQPAMQSSLPVRRHYVSSSLTSGAPPVPALPSLGGRRYLDRATPERDTTNGAGRFAEDRVQRKSSISQAAAPLGRTGSLTSRVRPSYADAQGAYR